MTTIEETQTDTELAHRSSGVAASALKVLTVTPRLPSAADPGSMAPAARQMRSLIEAGVEMDTLQILGLPLFKYLQCIPALRRRVQNVDVVHAHYGYCGWLARSQRHAPVVVSFMGDDLLGTRVNTGRVTRFSQLMVRANRRLAKSIDAVIVKSRGMADVVAPVNCHVVPNGVDIDIFQPQSTGEARQSLGWSGDAIRILFPGNPENPNKGFRLAEQVLARVRRVVERAVELIPLWNVDPDQVAMYMNASDVMIMASMAEGSPNVVKEAMACNLKVVSGPVGDAREMLDGVEGNVVCQRNADEMCEAIVHLLDGRDSRGRAALIDRRLDLASVADQVIEIYRSVI